MLIIVYMVSLLLLLSTFPLKFLARQTFRERSTLHCLPVSLSYSGTKSRYGKFRYEKSLYKWGVGFSEGLGYSKLGVG